jgi:chemotaxis protein MotA
VSLGSVECRPGRGLREKMFVIIGFVTVIGCVLGGYLMVGGHLSVLNQPSEFIIIFGAAIGSFFVGNRKA